MIVYELGWQYLDEESGKSDEQVIAVYSSEQLAQKAIERFKTQPRFIGHEEDFYISKYIINHEEWKDGYFCSDDLKGDMYVYNLIYEKLFSENTDFLTRDIAAFDKSKTEQIPDPFRVFGIIFVAFDSFYPFGIGNDNIDFIFQKIKDRNPVFTSGFHTDIKTVIVEKSMFKFKN